jgi:intracellular multiplication protein IcmC
MTENSLRNRFFSLGSVALFFMLMLGFANADAASASTIATQLTNTFRKIASISSDLSILFGAFMFVGGLYQLKRYGEARTMMSGQLTFSKPLMPILCGTLLMSFPTALGALMGAFWGSSWSSPLAYQVQSDYDVMVPAMLALIRLLGIICFFRAILSAVTAVGPHAQPGSKSKVGVLLFAGILLVNVSGTYDLVRSFFEL